MKPKPHSKPHSKPHRKPNSKRGKFEDPRGGKGERKGKVKKQTKPAPAPQKPKESSPSGLGAHLRKDRLRRSERSRRTVEAAPDTTSPVGPARIQKVLSAAGIASRREIEEMIAQGRVMVNGQRAEVGQKIDLDRDKVVVDGARVRGSGQRVTFVLNKPRGYISTRSDERGRPTVLDLIKGGGRYLYPVGRLDYDSEGLMLLTNDGELANGLTHPRHQIPKSYRALCEKALDDEQLERLRKGVMLEDGLTKPAEIGLHRRTSEGFWYEIVIREGRNRQVRRMFSAVGAGVRRLMRVAIGPLRLKELPVGAYRPITPEELALLKESYADHSVPAR